MSGENTKGGLVLPQKECSPEGMQWIQTRWKDMFESNCHFSFSSQQLLILLACTKQSEYSSEAGEKVFVKANNGVREYLVDSPPDVHLTVDQMEEWDGPQSEADRPL